MPPPASHAAGQALSDTQACPTTGNCARKPAPITTCLTDAQIQAELRRLMAANGLPSGIGAGAPVYFVIVPATGNVCMTGSLCADNYFCAYHADYADNGSDLIYAPIPLLNAVKSCQLDSNPPSALQEPNGIPADIAIENLSHEYNESITDPRGDAWYDEGSGNEEADYCQEYAATRDPLAGTDPNAYAPVLGTAADGSVFDQRINGDPYYTLTLSAAPRGALRLKATVNGPGTLNVAGRSYRSAKAGTISSMLPVTPAQRRALRVRQRLIVRVTVRFTPVVGRAVKRTARLTMTG